MARCINCDTLFTEGYNPFYCSEKCAIEKNSEPEPAEEDPNAYIREAHKIREKQKPRKVPEKKPVSRQNLLTRPWTL